MIHCPNCENKEFDGTLFCSECGTRLWQGSSELVSTANLTLGNAPNTAKLGVLVSSTTSDELGTITIRVRGTSELMRLAGKNFYTLGRSDPNSANTPDLDLAQFNGQEMGVSRLHAQIIRNDDGLHLEDLGSTNGTKLNGRLIAPNDLHRLNNGDEVRLGKLALNLYFVKLNTDII